MSGGGRPGVTGKVLSKTETEVVFSVDDTEYFVVEGTYLITPIPPAHGRDGGNKENEGNAS